MLEQDAGRKDRHEFSSSKLETVVSQANDPQQGARLIRAFLRITDPNIRLAIVRVVEKIGSAPADRYAVASDSEMPSIYRLHSAASGFLDQSQLHHSRRHVRKRDLTAACHAAFGLD
jgi:hypothetical protein